MYLMYAVFILLLHLTHISMPLLMILLLFLFVSASLALFLTLFQCVFGSLLKLSYERIKSTMYLILAAVNYCRLLALSRRKILGPMMQPLFSRETQPICIPNQKQFYCDLPECFNDRE